MKAFLLKHTRLLKHLGVLAISCGIFTAGRIVAEKHFGLTYDTHTIEMLVVAFILLHLGSATTEH